MPELRSFKHDEDVPPGTYVWFHFAGLTDTTAKLGQVQRMVDSMVEIGGWNEDRLTTDEATYLAAVLVAFNNDAKGLGAPVVRRG